MRQLMKGLMLYVMLTAPTPTARAEEQSSIAMHDGCIEEIVSLREYGEAVIEMFLPHDAEHIALPMVRTHVEDVRLRVSAVRVECVAYGDLSRAVSALVLLYESYHCIAQGNCFSCVGQEDCDDRPKA